jgi:hypothetical protein
MCDNGKLPYFNAFGSLNQKLGLTATQSHCHKERETADLYREGSRKNSESEKICCSGALSIESFEGRRWRGARRAPSMGILS